jgi:glucosyl-3-phosphoglycerate synthase
VVIPAKNEADTLPAIVTSIKQHLMIENKLVDELIVMDGDSTDATAEVAANAGARVIQVKNHIPDNGIPRGKGTALWLALSQCTSDILACADADVVNFDPKFISGIVSPLILNDDVCFIKGYYDRPLVLNGQRFEHQGGRVTEILVRPLLSAFYPDLAYFFQPLAGEYAFKSAVAKELSLFSGYGVEIGMLLDLYHKYGTKQFGQVCLGDRHHRNRSVRELGIMSFGIFHAFISRLKSHGIADIKVPISTTMISGNGDSFTETKFAGRALPPINPCSGDTPS